MDPAELEREVGQALRRLPAPRAPRTLAPRVMRAVGAVTRVSTPASGWRTWSGAWQALSLVAAGALAVVVALAVRIASGWLGDLAGLRVAASLWQAYGAPLAAPALAVITVMCTACALLVAGLKHVAWEGRWTVQS